MPPESHNGRKAENLSSFDLPPQSEKRNYVEAMFDRVASKYDFLNHFLSLGIDIYWRKQALKLVNFSVNPKALDLATGTADVAIMAAKNGARRVIGLDISHEMLVLGKKKARRKHLQDRIKFLSADIEGLPFNDGEFDVATIAFGIRNVPDISKSLAEICRVLKPYGVLIVLEFSRPRLFGFRQAYDLYFQRILPSIGSMVSKDKSAYHYLPNSVLDFPAREEFVALMRASGFVDIRNFDMTFGITTVYCGFKD